MSSPTDRPLSGRTALVTGASSGIGSATALALAALGADVAVGARRTDRLDDLARQVEGHHVRALVLELDVTDESSCTDAVETTRSELGRLDVVVNSAGLMLLGTLVDADTEDWRRMIETNVLGLMYVTRAALPAMVEQGSGDIVNLSSVAGRVAREGAGVYNASKWAVNAFSESLRQELSPSGVRVTMIEPGAVMTELTDHITQPAAKKASQEGYAKASIDADDVARAITYAVTQPPGVSVNEILIRPTGQKQP